MRLLMSSSNFGCGGGSLLEDRVVGDATDQREQFWGDVALQASHDLRFGEALSGPALHVGLG